MTPGMPPVGILGIAIGGTMLFFALKKEKSPEVRLSDIAGEQTHFQQPDTVGVSSAAATDEYGDDVIAAAMAIIIESEVLMSAPPVAMEFVQEPGQPTPEEAEALATSALADIDWDYYGMCGKADFSLVDRYAERIYESDRYKYYYVAAAGSFLKVCASGNFYHGYFEDLERITKSHLLQLIRAHIMIVINDIMADNLVVGRTKELKCSTEYLRKLSSTYRWVSELPEKEFPAPAKPPGPVGTEKSAVPTAPEQPTGPVEMEKSPDPSCTHDAGRIGRS